MYKNNFIMKAAATAAAKIDSMLLAKGKLRMDGPKLGLLPTPGKPNELFTTELEINDTPLSARNLLTKGQTQEEISQCSGAAISTRGRYMTQSERSLNPGERALYLFVQGPTKQSVDLAKQKIDEIIRGEQNQINPKSNTRHKLPPPPLMSIQTNVTSVDKVMIGLDHAPPAFDLRGRIIGPGGTNLEYIRNETGAVITLRGRGSLFIDSALGAESPEPMHLFIEHPRYDGVMAARQLALNLMETMQQELSQFLQLNPPNITNVQPLPVSPGTTPQGLMQAPQQMFTQIHQPMGIPPPMLSGPPPVQHPQLQHNIITQPAALQVQPALNIIQPNLQSNVIQQQGMIQQQAVQQPLLVQQSPAAMVLNSVPQNTQPAQLNLPPPGVHIPTQQGPLVPSNTQPPQQQHLLLSQPPPALNLPPPNMPPPSQGLIIVSSAPSQYTQHAQMFVSQAAHINPAQGLSQQAPGPYQYHIIQGSNPIYATTPQQPNSAGGIVTGHINELKTNPGQQFQTMTVQQVYQQPILSGQEQLVTQTLPSGQQYIVTPNSGPIYIVPPPNQTIQAQPNQTIETISVQSHHHIIPNSMQNQHQTQTPPISQTSGIENQGFQNLQHVQHDQQNKPNDKCSNSPKKSPKPEREDNNSNSETCQNEGNDSNEGNQNNSPLYNTPQQSEHTRSTDTPDKTVQAQNQFSMQPPNQQQLQNTMQQQHLQAQNNLQQQMQNNLQQQQMQQAQNNMQQQMQQNNEMHMMQQAQNAPPLFQNPPQMVPHPNSQLKFPLMNQQKPPQFHPNQVQTSQNQTSWVQTQASLLTGQNWNQNQNQILGQNPNLNPVQYQQNRQQLGQPFQMQNIPQFQQLSQQEDFNEDFTEQNQLLPGMGSDGFNLQQNPGVNYMEQLAMTGVRNLPPRPRAGHKRRLNDDNWRAKLGVGNSGLSGPNPRFQPSLPPSGRLTLQNNVNNRNQQQMPKGEEETEPQQQINESTQHGFPPAEPQEMFSSFINMLPENRSQSLGRGARLPPPPPPPPVRPNWNPNWSSQEQGQQLCQSLGQQWMG